MQYTDNDQNSKPVSRLFVEHLTNLDFSYINDQGVLTGESWAVDLEIQGELNREGMLLDFGDVKKSIKADAESLWDHKLVVPLHRPGLSLDGQTLTWSDDKGQTYKHKGPDISLYSVESAKFDKELLERHLESWLIEKWKCPQIQDISISFRTESIPDGQFQYSHGLKHHKGACQRIAHGHRSKVLPYSQNGLNQSATATLAEHLTNAYFVDESNIIGQTETSIELQYTAPEGDFYIQIPRSQAVIMQTETTIENIALYLLNYSRNTICTDICKIRVYEGWQKGAIAAL